MWPILFSVGPITIRTMSIFVVVGFLAAAFIFWRKGREEHYQEEELFDAFLLSTVVGMIAARLGFVLLHLDRFGANIVQWFDVVRHPGFNGLIGLVIAGLYLYRLADRYKWDVYEVLDFWSMGVALGMVFISLGSFFDGSVVGLPVGNGWGLRFPGVFEPVHPVQLYAAGFFLLLFWYLSWAEYRYRTFEWYRAGKKTGQTGFLVGVFMCSAGLFSFISTFLRPAMIEVFGYNIERFAAILLAATGFWLLWQRSGRSLPWNRDKRLPKKPWLSRREV
jgi:phosphatidylglycerol---prolipoprotein diacylglyceryl transferase